jgi:hypothetical protein
MPASPRHLALACRRLLPVLDTVDVETQDALARLCDNRPITQADGVALATALLLELQREDRRGGGEPLRLRLLAGVSCITGVGRTWLHIETVDFEESQRRR